MDVVLIVIVAPFAVGCVLSALARRRMHVVAALLAGLATAGALFVAAFLAARDEPERCSDCYEFWGRWWEPGLVLYLLTFFAGMWLAGVLAGRLVRRRLDARSARATGKAAP